MAKVLDSVVSIDLGDHELKAVLLARCSGQKFQLSRYAVRKIDRPLESPDQIAREVTLLLKEMGGRAKACVVAITSPDSLIRIIEQPSTPREVLRNALRLHGMSLLNQDVREFMLDCAETRSAGTRSGKPAAASGALPKVNYVVGGVPRKEVKRLDEAFRARRASLGAIQLAPICIFNSFECSHEEIFKNDPFLLVNIGHTISTVLVGLRGKLLLVRMVDYGGKELGDTLAAHGGGNGSPVQSLLENDDGMAIETARLSLSDLIREICASIGYFEGNHEEVISRIFLSGEFANSNAIAQLFAGELGMPCEMSNPFAQCEIALRNGRKDDLANDAAGLDVACGAALAFLKSKAGLPALCLNLYDEVRNEARRKKKDPFKAAMMLLLLMAVGFVFYYFWDAQSVSIAEEEVARVQGEWDKLEPKEKAAAARKDELDRDDKLAKAMVHEVENRFYWGPLLDQILRIVPPEIQITGFEGVLENNRSKKISLAISGMAAGDEPRAVAESLRIAFQKNLALRYGQTESVFKSLEDNNDPASRQGGDSPAVKFVIELSFVPADIDEEPLVKTANARKNETQ